LSFSGKGKKGITGSLTKKVVWTGVSGQEGRVSPSDGLWMLLEGHSVQKKNLKRKKFQELALSNFANCNGVFCENI